MIGAGGRVDVDATITGDPLGECKDAVIASDAFCGSPEWRQGDGDAAQESSHDFGWIRVFRMDQTAGCNPPGLNPLRLSDRIGDERGTRTP